VIGRHCSRIAFRTRVREDGGERRESSAHDGGSAGGKNERRGDRDVGAERCDDASPLHPYCIYSCGFDACAAIAIAQS